MTPAFEQLDLAGSKLEGLLPDDVLNRLDLSTLALESCELLGHSSGDTTLASGPETSAGGHSPDDESVHADLLFSARMRCDGALVFLIWEHQSTFGPTMPFRLLRYTTRTWERWLMQHPGAKTLPPVIALVTYHGCSPWRDAPELASMIAAPQDFIDATRPYVHFRFVLDDWSALTFEQLASPVLHPMVRLAQLALASSDSTERRRQAFHHMKAILPMIDDDDERTRAWRACFFRYMFRAAPTGMSAPEIRCMLREAVPPKQVEEVMNAAQELIQEGLDRGLVAGRVETLRAAIAVVLSARSMPLSEQGRARVAACADAELLNTWLRRAVTAQSEDDVFVRA